MTKTSENVKAFFKDNASTIFIGIGIAAELACVVTACVATAKTLKDIDEYDEVLDDALEHAEDDEQKDQLTRDNNKRLALTIAKHYSIPVVLCAASIASTIVGFRTERKKKEEAIALATEAVATASSIAAAFAKYRSRVIEKYGAQADYDIYMGRSEIETITEEVDPKTGKKVKKKHVSVVYDPIDCDIYKREFGPWTSKEWDKDPTRNLSRLKNLQIVFERQLNGSGSISYNEVLEYLGVDVSVGPYMTENFLPKSIGWVSQRVFDMLPDEWDYNGRHYRKADYDSKIDLGITAERMEETKYYVFQGCSDDVYEIRPNCYPTDEILEFASKYIKKKNKDSLALDRATLREYDHAHNINI